MNGKSTVWIVLFLLSTGAAGTGFYLNYRNSQQVQEQNFRIEEITDNLVTARTQNRTLEAEVQTLKASVVAQPTGDQTTQLKTEDDEIVALKEQLSGKETEIATLTEQMTAIRQQQDTLTTLTRQLEEKEAELQETLAQQQQFQQQQAELARELQTKTDENQALAAQLATAADVQTILTQVQAERDQLAAQFATSRAISEQPDLSVDERVLNLTQKIIALETSNQEKDAVIARQDDRVRTLTDQLTARQQDLEDKIIALTSAIQTSQTTSSDVAGTSELDQKLHALTQQLEATNQGLSQQEDIAELRAQLSAKDVQEARFSSQLEALTSERDQLNAQIAKYEQQLAQKDAVAQDLTVRLEQLTKEVLPAGSLDQKKIAELTRQIAELTQQIADITQQITSQESQKERLQEQITGITQQLENAIQEKDGLLLDLMKQRESEKQATEAEKEKLQQQILTLEANINVKDTEISNFKAQLDEKETALSQLQSTFEADVAMREEKIASLQQALKEMDEKYQELTGQYALQEQLAATLAEQKNAAETSAAALQEKNAELGRQLNEAQAKTAILEENLAQRETEYQQKIAEHNQMITQLKNDIDNENIEKTTIQERLQTELERSESAYQERLKQLAAEKEQEIKALQTTAETYAQMTKTLSQQIESKDIEISQYKEQLTVTIVNRIVFSSGRATINAEGRKVLDTVGEFLKQNLEGRQIQVNGHTDNVPIGRNVQDMYPTNWELSTARAVNVVRYLKEYADIPAEKLSAVGHGEYQPIADNNTPEGRALNRRIEIVLFPELPISE